MTLKDFFYKFKTEGPSFLEIGVMATVISGIRLIIKYFIQTNYQPIHFYYRYAGYQSSEGLSEAIFIIGVFLILVGLVLLRKKVILKKVHWSYFFYKKGYNYYLDVVKGSVAVYEVTVKLTREQRNTFWRKGYSYIDQLVDEITKKP